MPRTTLSKTGEVARRWSCLALLCFVRMCVLIFFVWSAGAIYYLHYLPLPVRTALSVFYVVAGLWLIINAIRNRKRARRWTLDRSVALIAVSIPVVYLLTLFIRPSNDRDWAVDQNRLPTITIDSGEVTIDNFRNNTYRSESDFDVNYETRKIQLEEIREVWFIVQRFSATEGIAHTFLSFGNPGSVSASPEYFSVSVETRREAGESYSPWRGAFRNFEINYVVGDERDLIGVRTIHRPDDQVLLYKTHASPQQAREIFADIAGRINKLQETPEFYNTFLNNCANGIVVHTRDITPEPVNWLDPRIVLPGYSDALVFEKGLIGASGSETLQQLRDRSRIDVLAREAGITGSFSSDIRSTR